jgi:hypothetical protein
MTSTRISFFIDNDLLKRLDKIALLGSIDRTKLMGLILDHNVNILFQTEKVGVLSLNLLLESMSNNLENWVDEMRKKPIII